MTPLLFFFYLVALAAGVFVVGLALLMLYSVYLLFVGWALRPETKPAHESEPDA